MNFINKKEPNDKNTYIKKIQINNPGFHLGFQVEAARIRTTVLAFAFMVAVCLYGQLSVLLAFLCGGLYFVIKCLDIKLPPKANYLWLALELFVAATFTEQAIQFMLLEAEDRMKTSMSKTGLNILCCFAIYLVFVFISANVVKSVVAGHVLLMAFAGVDYFVYKFRGNEIIFADAKSLGTGLSVASEYSFTLDAKAAWAILGSILFVALMRKLQLEFKRKYALRCICICAAVISVTRVVLKTGAVNTESWEQKGTYRNGFVLNFILSIRDSFVEKPADYSLDTIKELENTYGTVEEETQSSEDDPTIIVIMDESFADLSAIGNLQTTEPVTPFIDSMNTNVIKGYTLSSVFGAKTPNSEWEFLTGTSMAYLPSGSVAYQQYVSEDTYSLVNVLENYGYSCMSMHPYYATGWSRNRVYPILGFEQSLFLDDFDQTNLVRDYVSDEEMFDKVIEQYESKDEKQFILGVTMQNHGGYTDIYDNFASTVRMSNGYYSDVNQYLSLIHETDKAVEKLITYFQNVDDNVLICFFGDHQPSLQSNFYRQLNGKGLSGLTTDELEELFQVPFFIWTNYESETEEAACTSLNYLSTMVLERAGLKLPAYNQFLQDMMDTVPAMNSRAYYSKTQGGFVHYTDAVGEEADLLGKYQILQYNNMFDKKDRSEIFFSR